MTAALVGPMVAAGDRSGSIALASLMALLVGLVCLLAALLKLAFLADLLSQPILVGYLAGVAMLMIAGQMHTLTGIGPRADSLGRPWRYWCSAMGPCMAPAWLWPAWPFC